MSAVEPSSGSTLGGTQLTITGSGFPTQTGEPSDSADSLTVTVGGEPCIVEASTFSQVTCRTAPQPPGWTTMGWNNDTELFIGCRGVEVLEWPTTDVDDAFRWTGSALVCPHSPGFAPNVRLSLQL